MKGEQIMFDSYPEVVNTKQIAEMLNISYPTANKLLREGKIQCRYIGRTARAKKENVLAYISGTDNEK